MKVLDLFCGAGGFSKGFEMAGFKIVAGVDFETTFLKTFSSNHGARPVDHDISKEMPGEILDMKVDVVIGSPPCQGFSDARGSRSVYDPRNELVFDFIRWVSELRPKVTVMENVSGMLTISDTFMETVKKMFGKAGYLIRVKSPNAAEYGVPQKRKRVFCLGFRKDLGIKPAFPKAEFFERRKDRVVTGSRREQITVGEAISDLPEPTEEGTVKLSVSPLNEYQKLLRGSNDIIHNHVAKYPSPEEMWIAKRIPEGKMYRSTRFGKKYVHVWELYEEEFTREEAEVFKFIARRRSKNGIKMGNKEVGHVPVSTVAKGADVDERVIHGLHEKGWLRKREENGVTGYDFNTKAGVRPRYMRLSREEVANTILTTDFIPREKLHPVKNRGLSLREGARIQSFPDDFTFEGDFDSVAKQIGNAVPPLLAKKIAEYILGAVNW